MWHFLGKSGQGVPGSCCRTKGQENTPRLLKCDIFWTEPPRVYLHFVTLRGFWCQSSATPDTDSADTDKTKSKLARRYKLNWHRPFKPLAPSSSLGGLTSFSLSSQGISTGGWICVPCPTADAVTQKGSRGGFTHLQAHSSTRNEVYLIS